MNTFQSAPAALSRSQRAASAWAAAGASAAVLSLLLALFGAASSGPWLPDTPAAVVQASACEQAASRSARNRCMQEAAVRWQAAEHRSLRLASSR